MHDIRISQYEFDRLPKHGQIGQWVTWAGRVRCTSYFTVVGPPIYHDTNSPEWAQYVAESAAWLKAHPAREIYLPVDTRYPDVLCSALSTSHPNNPHWSTMVKTRTVVRRGRNREVRLRQSGGVKVGRRGRVFVYRAGVRVTDQEQVLAAVGRKV